MSTHNKDVCTTSKYLPLHLRETKLFIKTIVFVLLYVLNVASTRNNQY